MCGVYFMCDDKEFLESICEEYFKGFTKPKHLRFFEENTPEGNHITGYINQKPNHYLGSMIILTVNNEPCKQFIQSMPKIHYFKDERDILKDEFNRNECYEKLDGSCLILYPLKNKAREVIEIVPKTRGRPVADAHFIDLFNKVNQLPIKSYYAKHPDDILIFELYGILNQHEIINYDTGIDIRLISIVDGEGRFTNKKELASYYDFKLPDKVFELYNIDNTWFISITTEKYRGYFDEPVYEYPTNIDAMLGMKHLLEELNTKFQELNGRLATEGVVVNTRRSNGSKKFLKCKPRDIENKHKTVNGIPRTSITKEVLKYFDEYGSEVDEIYKKDPNHHTEYLHRMLEEEYAPELIQKSKKKIERIFMQIWESKQVPESLHSITDELIEEYGEEGISYCMRVFAERYPMKKKDARLVYGILEKKFIKKGLDL